MQTHKAVLLALSLLLAVSTAAAESATRSSRQHGHVRHRSKSKKASKLRSTEAVSDPTQSPIRAREPVARAIEVCFSKANT
jgi:hypothetical protein